MRSSAMTQPDPRADDPELGMGEQPLHLPVELLRQPGVVVVARGHEVGRDHPRGRRCARPTDPVDPVLATTSTVRPSADSARQGLVRRLLVVHDDAADRTGIALSDDALDGDPDELAAPPGRDDDGDGRSGPLRCRHGRPLRGLSAGSSSTARRRTSSVGACAALAFVPSGLCRRGVGRAVAGHRDDTHDVVGEAEPGQLLDRHRSGPAAGSGPTLTTTRTGPAVCMTLCASVVSNGTWTCAMAAAVLARAGPSTTRRAGGAAWSAAARHCPARDPSPPVAVPSSREIVSRAGHSPLSTSVSPRPPTAGRPGAGGAAGLGEDEGVARRARRPRRRWSRRRPGLISTG